MYKKIQLLEIIKKNRCYFISPHLDDAILSAGGLISTLAKTHKVKVITIFSKASEKPYTFFCRRYLNTCHYQDADMFFKDRKKEDQRLFHRLGIDPQYLDFADAAWRKKTKKNWLINILPELSHLYPTRFHILSGRISQEDIILIDQIKKKLISFIPPNKKTIVFCPLAIGQHVDHIIVREICRQIFKQVIFWSDYPYNLSYKNISSPFIYNASIIRWDTTPHKRLLIKQYKTQAIYLFKNKPIRLIPETYYFNDSCFISS